MASGDSHVNLSYGELQQLCTEQETLLQSLLDQLQAAEDERDRASHGIEILTDALRRRRCCDHETNGRSH
jgi:HPt (histidine-containing phosphotransfer) domain-containing protein